MFSGYVNVIKKEVMNMLFFFAVIILIKYQYIFLKSYKTFRDIEKHFWNDFIIKIFYCFLFIS